MSSTLPPQAEEQVQRLRRHLKRARGFSLVFLFVSHPLIAAALKERVASWLPSQPLRTIDGLAQAVDVALLAADGEGAAWLDLGRGPDDAVAETQRGQWLARLNEQRAQLEKDWRCALLIQLPEACHAETWRLAPDLWAVRSLALDFPGVWAAQAPVPGRTEADARPAVQLGALPQAQLDEWRRLAPLAEQAPDTVAVYPGLRLVDSLLQAGYLELAREVASQTEDHARRRLALAGAENSEAQRDLSIAHNKIGDLLSAQGDLPGALAAYRKCLDISERLARQDPANAGWQRELSIAHEKIGDLLRAQGDLSGAPAAYRKSLEIRERLARQDPANAGWQRDLSVSHNKIGDLLRAQGDLPGALAAFRKDLEISERLAWQDPSNAGWQRDLCVSFNKLGGVEQALGRLVEARAVYRESLALARRLHTLLGDIPLMVSDLDEALTCLAEVERALGDETTAASLETEAAEIKKPPLVR